MQVSLRDIFTRKGERHCYRTTIIFRTSHLQKQDNDRTQQLYPHSCHPQKQYVKCVSGEPLLLKPFCFLATGHNQLKLRSLFVPG